MKFCPKCGVQLQDDDLFCMKCGMSQSSGVQAPGTPSNIPSGSVNFQTIDMSQITEYFREVKNMYLYITLKPVTTIKNAIAGIKIQSTIIMLFILSILFGLLNMWYVNQSISAALGSSGISLKSLKIPSGSIFFYLFLLFLISSVVFSLLLFLTGSFLFKTEANFKSSFNVTVACTIPLVNALLVSILFNYITGVLGTLCLIAGILIMLICLFISMREIMHTNEDITLTVFILCFTLFNILLYLIGKLLLSEVLKGFINSPLF